ncbi:hypothetical protein [Bacteroides sp.]
MSLRRLIIVSSFFLSFFANLFAGGNVRGWIILSDNMDRAIRTIKTAKEYNINQLQLSHEIIHDLKAIKEEKVCEQVNKLIRFAHLEGIDEVLLWDHSLYSLDYYPSCFRTGPDGTINLDNPTFWEWFKDDYHRMLNRAPEADGLVLTFIETGAYAEKQYSVNMKTPEEKLAAVVNAISDVVIGERGKKLYIRTFAYSEEEYKSTIGCIKHIKSDKVILMMKETPHDFFLTHPDNSYIRKMNRPTIVEFDSGNEYSGQGIVANTWPEYTMKRWGSYINCPNVTGYVARTDRYGDTSIVGTANEIQLYALKRMTEEQTVSPMQIYNEFITSRYGEDALLPIRKAFQNAYDIVTSVFYTLGTNLTDHSFLNYENNKWGYSRHVSGRWIDPPMVLVKHDINKTFHYWKDIINHIAPVHFKSLSSPLAVEVKTVFDNQWIEPDEKMDSVYYNYILTEKQYGVKLASEAVAEIEKVKPLLESAAYNDLYQLFYRTYLTACLHEAVCTAYYGSRIYVRAKQFHPAGLKERIFLSLKKIEQVSEDMNLLVNAYPVGQYNWLNDAKTALKYRDKVLKILKEHASESGITERSLSKAEYFSWINNTNEGTTESQTLANLIFFEWLRQEYGMQLDIYAFDAGLIDGKNIYGSINSQRFKNKFPKGLESIYLKAKQNGVRLGLWGGPDGFGNTPESAEERKEMLVSLCRNYDWALFKFDAVCGPLREEKEDLFVDMIGECRKYSPDLILLNHRLGLKKAEQCATTFLWEGKESYIDVNSFNTCAAPHNRVGALGRGLVPDLKRLTEDHGVCLSSCLDYWEDELVLQAFNRSLLLSPQIYGNPWLLSDREFPKLARIFNLHRKFSGLLVDGIELPSAYGKYAVSRGDDKTRLITLRNLTWEPQKVKIVLNHEIGLEECKHVKCRLYHPVERILGIYNYGESVEVTVLPFRSMLFYASADESLDGIGIEGTDFEIIKDVAGKPIEINLLGFAGTQAHIKLNNLPGVEKIEMDGQDVTKKLSNSKTMNINFEGGKYSKSYHRKIADLSPVSIPYDVNTLYEATVFAADNNAMEVRSLYRSGTTKIEQVEEARNAFFNQSAFVNRGVWDKYLFDGDMGTGFWPSKRKGDIRIKGGCFRLDLGESLLVDSILIKVKNEYELQPLLVDEGNVAYISSDLKDWKPVSFWAGTTMSLKVGERMRYLKMKPFPDAIAEVEVYAAGKKVEPDNFRANNLFADTSVMGCAGAWKAMFRLDEVTPNSYLCVAVNGKHGVEGAYVTLKVDGQYVGASSRATSYPANPWENTTVQSNSNYTYFFELDENLKNKDIEVFLLAYDEKNLSLFPEVWITAYPMPYEKKTLVIHRSLTE